MDTSTLSGDGKFKSCPFCFDFFDHDRLVFIHVMCRHPEEYYDAMATMATVDEVCAKIPGVRGSVLEAKMRNIKHEPKQQLPSSNADAPPPIEQTQTADSIESYQRTTTTTLFNVVDSTPPRAPLLLDDINLDINENEASVNSSPCCLLSGPQSIEDSHIEQAAADLNNLVSFVENIHRNDDSILINNCTFETSNNVSFVDNSPLFIPNQGNTADASMPILIGATAPPPNGPMPCLQQQLITNNLQHPPTNHYVSNPNFVQSPPMTYFVPNNNVCTNLGQSNVQTLPPTLMQTSSPITTTDLQMNRQKKKWDRPIDPSLHQFKTSAGADYEPSTKKPRANAKEAKGGCQQRKIINEKHLEISYGALNRVTNKSSVKCLACQREFNTTEDVFQHEAIAHEGMQKFLCPVDSTCLEVFSNFNQISTHLRSHHPLPDDPSGNVRHTLRCRWCSASFTSFLQFTGHIDIEYRDRRMALIRLTIRKNITVTCRKCKATFGSREAWFAHRANVCYSNEPEAQKNIEMANRECHLSCNADRLGCNHNRQICAYYPACINCAYAHPICPMNFQCQVPGCIDDHNNRAKYCGFGCIVQNHV